LYRSGTQEEIEATLSEWLKAEIARLVRQRAECTRDPEHPELQVVTRLVAVH